MPQVRRVIDPRVFNPMPRGQPHATWSTPSCHVANPNPNPNPGPDPIRPTHGSFRGLAVGGVGYFSCAVVGYAIGLAITLAANAYGLTFNGVQGQPALLYLVPGVLGALLLRACTRSQLAEVWTGSSLPSPSLDEDSDGSGSSSHPLEPHGGHEGSSCCCDYKRM